ncbi:hypothetical protein D3C87_2138150 [compost metagenome]
MEIFRFNIRPETEIVKIEAFKASLDCCHSCGTTLEFTYTEFSQFNTLREEAQCQSCGTQVLRDHKVQ